MSSADRAIPAVTGPGVPYALARFRRGHGDPGIGVVVGDRIRPLSGKELGAGSLNAFLAGGDWARIAAAAAASDGWRDLREVTIVAPVQPRAVLQAGANYRTHVVQLIMSGMGRADAAASSEELRARAERAMDERAASGRPFIFLGHTGCVVGSDQPLVLPAGSDQHDWELELAAVIGREARRVPVERALAHVAGYTIVNDITTRDLVFPEDAGAMGADWFRSKNAPGFLPTGPFLVPAEFVDPDDASLLLELNGQRMQDASSSELVFDVAQIVAAASHTTVLRPGDLVLTGSPAGNGQHWGRFLRDGDVMRGTITALGTQTIRCTAEPAQAAEMRTSRRGAPLRT
ncbi:fumarylacetoacetate hydrolase family protein [Microbacterium sp.]|uniref:fumarylacetoacetate hydrolase family protein n=1 Tax=Microbacterium sp. TaxID=51671 RepID=UPI003F977F29